MKKNRVGKRRCWPWVSAALCLLMLAAIPDAIAQETGAEDWLKSGQELYNNGSYQEALNAYGEGLGADPQNASLWHFRGLALAGMGHGAEANLSLQKSIEILDQRLGDNPEDLEALWMKAEAMDILGKSEAALFAYDRVAEQNSSYALGAWIRTSDILAALGQFNQSAEAFGRAMALAPANRSYSRLEFQRQGETAVLFTKSWVTDGQIQRVSVGSYNVSTGSFDEIEQINSDFVAALQLKVIAADPNRHGGSLLGSSLNWDVYSRNLPKMTDTAGIPAVVMAGINPVGDEFVKISNDMRETTNLHNWRLEISGSNASLPECQLMPGKAVRIHLGRGQENETDLFLNSNLDLNDSAGSVTLIDDRGVEAASLDYWTRLDGSIAHAVTIGRDFVSLESPVRDDMVQKGAVVEGVAGSGPFVASRTKIAQER